MIERLPKVLVIDDDPKWGHMISLVLDEECLVDSFTSIDQGLSAIESHFYDIILLDLNFQNDDRTGYEIFKHISASDRGADVIVVSGETEASRLIQVINAGVAQFLPKPVQPNTLRQAVHKTLEQREIRFRTLNRAQSTSGEVHLVGSSPQICHLKQQIERIIKSGIRDVLIIGETGTGKEVIAKYLTQLADPAKRLIPIHCAAISDGLAESELFGHVKGAFTGADRDRPSAFEAASGGFIFFDEIGDMPLNQQAKLLRVLQERAVQRVGSYEERTVNFRSISATNVNLDKAIVDKTFREDLYYRIAKETLLVPPLRERPEDVPELIHHFLSINNVTQKKLITNEAMALLQAYHWPGNVRQLKTSIESLSSRCPGKVIRESDICQVLPDLAGLYSKKFKKSLVGNYGNSPYSSERHRFARAILKANGDRTKAAELLGVSRATFFRRAKSLGLVKSRTRDALSKLG